VGWNSATAGDRDDEPTGSPSPGSVVPRHDDVGVHDVTDMAEMEGVDAAEWRSLLERGRQAGSVHAEQVTHVLRHVELTGEVLENVARSLTEAGISLDETVDGEEVDEVDDVDDVDDVD